MIGGEEEKSLIKRSRSEVGLSKQFKCRTRLNAIPNLRKHSPSSELNLQFTKELKEHDHKFVKNTETL